MSDNEVYEDQYDNWICAVCGRPINDDNYGLYQVVKFFCRCGPYVSYDNRNFCSRNCMDNYIEEKVELNHYANSENEDDK